MTTDPELLDDVLRLASAAGVEVDVASDVASARPRWSCAPVVLVGADLGEAVARSRIRRRGSVVLLSRDLDDARVWKLAVDVGAEHVAVLPDAENWLVSRLGDASEPTGSALTIGVVGGRGGAGASTLAAALALTGVRHPGGGRSCLLVDADPLGGGIDLIFGGEQVEGVRWTDLATSSGRIRGVSLRESLPRVGDLAVLSFGREDGRDVRAEAMSSVLSAARRGGDLVVIDVPRHFDEVADVALTHADIALLVVPAEVRACAAAVRVAARVLRHCGDVRVVVRGPAPGGLDGADVAAALGLPLAGFLAAEPDLAAALERGEPPASGGRGPLARFCAGFLDSTLPLPGQFDSAGGSSRGWTPS